MNIPENMIQVFKPSLGKEELDALAEIFETGWIGLGPKTHQFEEEFAALVGARHAIAVNSATAALHLSCLALGIGPGDEVLVPTITFVSTAHAPAYCGAKVVFVDVDPTTLNIDIDDMARQITSKTKAIIPVHFGGHACPMDKIWALAKKHDLHVIEDAAHAAGSTFNHEPIGGLSGTDTTCFSFQAVKNLPVGDGGMITTNRDDLAQQLRSLRWVGIDKSTWDRTEEVVSGKNAERTQYGKYGWYYEVHDLGYKYHMNDIAAVIGIEQLKKLPAGNARRREIVATYNQAFSRLDGIEIPVEHPYTQSACHNYVIKTDQRDELNLHLKQCNIASGVHYMPIHLHPYYRNLEKVSCPQAEKVWTQLISLPIYPGLSENDQRYVIECVTALH